MVMGALTRELGVELMTDTVKERVSHYCLHHTAELLID